MWKKILTGRYEKGEDTLEITCLGYQDYMICINENEYVDSFNSIEELQTYLKSINAEEIILPKKIEEIEKWFTFDGDENYEKVFSKKKEDGIIHAVLMTKICDSYSIYLRENKYCDDYLLRDTLDYIDEFNKEPENDLEVDAFEAMGHGSSGMSDWDFDLKTMEEVKELLKNKYGILFND